MSRTAVTIPTADGQCNASVFLPDTGAGRWPTVVVFMDGIGIRPAMLEVGERIAQHGFFVLLPDLFYRAGPYVAPDPRTVFGDPAARQAWFSKYVSTASPENVRRDMVSFLEFLEVQPDADARRIGTTGYCMGGGLSLAAAGHFPDRVVAAASFHGGRLATDAPDSPHLLAPKMRAHVQVAGAIEDASFPDDMKQRLDDALSAASVPHVVETWPARHGWVLSDTPVHDPVQADRHYKTLIDLFARTLGR